MIIRDYIRTTVDGKEYIWLVADIDNYLYTGIEPLTKHHLTIIPAEPLYNAPMHNSISAVSYIESDMVKNDLNNLVSNNGIIYKSFGNHLLSYSALHSNNIRVDTGNLGVNQYAGWFAGASGGYSWFTRNIDLMSEANVYGTNVFSSSGYDTGQDYKQYAIFQLKPDFINRYSFLDTNGNMIDKTFSFWLKNFACLGRFSLAGGYGEASGDGVTNIAYGVRPRFLIGM